MNSSVVSVLPQKLKFITQQCWRAPHPHDLPHLQANLTLYWGRGSHCPTLPGTEKKLQVYMTLSLDVKMLMGQNLTLANSAWKHELLRDMEGHRAHGEV